MRSVPSILPSVKLPKMEMFPGFLGQKKRGKSGKKTFFDKNGPDYWYYYTCYPVVLARFRELAAGTKFGMAS